MPTLVSLAINRCNSSCSFKRCFLMRFPFVNRCPTRSSNQRLHLLFLNQRLLPPCSSNDRCSNFRVLHSIPKQNNSVVNHSMNDHEDHLLPVSFGKQTLTTYAHGNVNVDQNHKYNHADTFDASTPFSLILPSSETPMCSEIELENDTECSHEILNTGMVLLKNYLSLTDQVELVKICESYGVGPGGFYQPSYENGAKLNLQMMCFGRNWDPRTLYEKLNRSDGSVAPPIPDKLVSLVEKALEDSRELVSSKDEIPLMSPDICIANFYTTSGRLGLHQDRDESPGSLERGLPVVSFSIGDSAEFLFGRKREVKRAENVLLESGDVLIFGGKSRHVYHGVKTIIPDSAPRALIEATNLRPGRLNLTFRQF